MVRTQILVVTLLLVGALACPVAGVEAASEERISATVDSEPIGVETTPVVSGEAKPVAGVESKSVAVQGMAMVPTDWAQTHSLEEVASNLLMTAGTVESSLVMLAPIAGVSRYDETNALDHETRERLFETVLDRPGIHLAGLADAVGEPLSTVRYHSRVLQSAGLIEAEKYRGYKRQFPVAVDGPDRALQTALASEAKRSVLLSVARTEPASVTSLAQELNRATSTVSHHLSQLEADGLVVRERNGKTVETRVTPSVRDELRNRT
jgi:predicted transcriptional regulator